jgi:hypothetical protein
MITLLTFVGYFAAFAYHREYAVAFGIPPDLISINPSSLLVAAYDIWNFLFSLGLFIAVFYMIIGQTKSALDVRLRRIGVLSLPFATLWNIYEDRTSRIIGLLVAAFILYSEFLRPLWKYRDLKGYLQKLQHAEEEKGFFDKVVAQFPGPAFLALLALTVVTLSGVAGRNKALHTDRFLVLADRPDFIVPALSSDSLVAVRIDRKMKKILPEIVVITREPGKPLNLRWEQIGRLTPVGD